MRKIISTLIFGLLLSFQVKHLRGQNQLPTIIPPSPESASLAKFTETPISHYTGLPGISIPIYTIQQNGISIPVSLSYHARGVQISEVASRVGLGWALSYGGSISRQTRGIADEDGGYGYLNNDYLLNFFSSSTKRTSVWNLYSNHNEYDFTPDLFHFSAGGVSGKFVIDQTDDQIILQEFDDIKVQYTIVSNKITQFILTDALGNKYYYGLSKNGLRTARNEDEIVENIESVSGTSPAITSPSNGRTYDSWQLMDIETPNGEVISYEYELETSIYYRRSYDTYDNSTGKFINYASKVRSYQYQVKKITFEQGRIEFVKSTTEREDLNSSYVLNQIDIYNSQSTLIKSYDLTYEYKTSPSNGNQLAYLKTADPKSSKRLFLKTVTETDGGANSIPAYLFDYNSTLLPNRFSNSQDVWGYYNGANNGSYLTFFSYAGSVANRTVDTVLVKAGLLEKITYPTGGTTEFVYEQNKALPVGFYSNLNFQAINPRTDNGLALSPLEYNAYFNTSTQTYEKTFTIGSTKIGDLSKVIEYPFGSGCTSSSSSSTSCYFKASIVGSSGTIEIFSGSSTVVLAPGNYTLKVKPQNHTHNPLNPDHFFLVNLDWVEQVASEDDVIYGPGSRIKQIINKSNGVTVGTKTYEYENTSGNSSGILFSLPNFYSLTQSIGGTPVYTPNGSLPGNPLGIAQGNSIGYSRVTEYNGDQSGNTGKTVYTFTQTEDSGLYYSYPFSLPTDNEWLRGKPLTVEHYKKNGGSYTLVKKTDNQYLYADYVDLGSSSPTEFTPLNIETPLANNLSSSLTYLKNKRKSRLPLVVFGDDGLGSYFYKTYFLTGGTMDLWKTTETEYYDGGLTFSTLTTLDYDYDDHYQLERSELTDSQGDVYKTENFYPADRTQIGLTGTPLTAATDLFNDNRKAILLQSKSYKNTTLLSQLRNNYKVWSGTITDLETVQTAKSTGSLETRVRYHSYDTYGNVREVSLENGTKVVYLYGYASTLPVAKIENANLSDVTPVINQSILDSPSSDTALRTELNKLRTATALKNAQVTTITYKRGVGMSSVTSPNGLTVYYEYDTFGRLKYVKDKDNNILSKSEYVYQINANTTTY